MAITDQDVITVTSEAAEAIIGIRSEEPDAADLALTVSITGLRGLQFVYELTFIPVEDAADEDVLQRFGDLPVVVRADSVSRLQGAAINVSDAGLSIDNPNTPSPHIEGGGAALEGPLAERLQTVIAERINPAIAGHGGFVEVVAIEEATVYLRMGGGCQGCGLAQVTLSQGIEQAIRNAIPEIVNIIDVTDHASGENPFYESAKK